MFVVASMGGVAILLLFNRAVHLSNFHVSSKVENMSTNVLASAWMALVGQIENTGGAIKPVVIVLDRVG